MCGIAGILYNDRDRPVDRHVLGAMAGAIAHRGPDAEGLWSEPGLGLAHRRLSIIDLAGGDQPISNEDGSVQVVFNGEIYNYRELHADLERKGHLFHTNSDTEVLVHLYEELGERLVEQLRGMFAFALWDRKARRLLLAHDRLGIKPLYLYRDGEKLLFGSEIKAILAHPGVSKAIDVEALEDYLAFGMIPGPRSIFQGIEKLPPAHSLLVEPGNWCREPKRYWRLRIDPDHSVTSDDWQDAIRAKLNEAVRLHMIADVPVGAFLSGGLDSSVLVALCAGKVESPLQTFSIGFREDEFNELPAARLVAERYGTQHVEEIVTPDAIDLLDELSRFYDEPFADSSAIPTYLVSRLASQSVKVVISGDGGDEAFGGYARYAHDLKEAEMRRSLPGWFRRVALGPSARVWPKADWLPRPLRAKTRLTNLALEPGPAYANTMTACRQPLRRRLIAPDLVATLNGHDPARPIRDGFAEAPAGDVLGGMIAADVEVVLPDDFLVKVDRASMAHGLEVRPPLLDHELLEMAARIPSEWKVRRGETKWIFKRAFADALPPELLGRPKRGFEIPIDAWFRGPLRTRFEDEVLASSGRFGDLINRDGVRRIYRDHVTGAGRYGGILWSLQVLSCWADRYL